LDPAFGGIQKMSGRYLLFGIALCVVLVLWKQDENARL
jgi:hypothetical protein